MTKHDLAVESEGLVWPDLYASAQGYFTLSFVGTSLGAPLQIAGLVPLKTGPSYVSPVIAPPPHF